MYLFLFPKMQFFWKTTMGFKCSKGTKVITDSLIMKRRNGYCKFGIARRNEAISADGLTKKWGAIVSKYTYSNQGGVFTSIQIS